jgi:cytochrome P450
MTNSVRGLPGSGREQVPAGVGERPVIDFDHHSTEFGQDHRKLLHEVRETCPVAWTESHGGYWLLTRYGDVHKCANDDWTFSSRHDLPNDGRSFTGCKIPDDPQRYTPIETDMPRFRSFRKALNAAFSPSTAKQYQPSVERYTTEAIDKHIESGSIDFVLDLANPVPAKLTLEILGIPVEEWQPFAYAFHTLIYSVPGTPEMLKAQEALVQCSASVAEVISSRRREPRDDLISYLTRMEVDGETVGDEEITEVILLILGGGLDTTTALVACALAYLEERPDQRRWLIEDPARIPAACEEFLRYYSPVQLLGRTATKEVEVGSQSVSPGERIALCWSAANHDPAVFERPNELILDRFPNRHMAFGVGAHRCLGSHIARMEATVMLTEILRRMPDYKILGAEPYPSIGVVNGYINMPAEFTPGPRSR